MPRCASNQLHVARRNEKLSQLEAEAGARAKAAATVMVLWGINLLLAGIVGVVLPNAAGVRDDTASLREHRPKYRPADDTDQQNGVKALHPHADIIRRSWWRGFVIAKKGCTATP